MNKCSQTLKQKCMFPFLSMGHYSYASLQHNVKSTNKLHVAQSCKLKICNVNPRNMSVWELSLQVSYSYLLCWSQHGFLQWKLSEEKHFIILGRLHVHSLWDDESWQPLLDYEYETCFKFSFFSRVMKGSVTKPPKWIMLNWVHYYWPWFCCFYAILVQQISLHTMVCLNGSTTL